MSRSITNPKTLEAWLRLRVDQRIAEGKAVKPTGGFMGHCRCAMGAARNDRTRFNGDSWRETVYPTLGLTMGEGYAVEAGFCDFTVDGYDYGADRHPDLYAMGQRLAKYAAKRQAVTHD